MQSITEYINESVFKRLKTPATYQDDGSWRSIDNDTFNQAVKYLKDGYIENEETDGKKIGLSAENAKSVFCGDHDGDGVMTFKQFDSFWNYYYVKGTAPIKYQKDAEFKKDGLVDPKDVR